jgi:3-phenylpropionate/trans-cinnamate dioxygenase ferredoxin subunit
MTELTSTGPRTLGPADAVPNGFVVPYYLDDLKRRISVARIDDRLYAFDDLCTCAQPPCPLSGGLLTGTTLMCQCHGSRFDVSNGGVLSGPATEPLNGYTVREVDGDIELRF